MTGTHTYDSQGRPLIHNLTGSENEMNYRYEYEYDEKGRLIRAESWCPSCQCEHVCISYQYNNADQVIRMINQGGIPSGITEYTHDMQGRLIQDDDYVYEYADCTAIQYALYETVKNRGFYYY